jgi:hypothetical protein
MEKKKRVRRECKNGRELIKDGTEYISSNK